MLQTLFKYAISVLSKMHLIMIKKHFEMTRGYWRLLLDTYIFYFAYFWHQPYLNFADLIFYFYSLSFYCSYNFSVPFTRKFKIRTSNVDSANATELFIDFRPSKFIFAGLEENFPQLKILNLNEQNIKFIERKDFTGFSNLQALFLADNQIEILPENVFVDLQSLKKLDISDNKITFFPTNILSGLKHIEDIWTSGNPSSAASIDFNSVPNMKLWNETWFEYYQKGEKFDLNGEKI